MLNFTFQDDLGPMVDVAAISATTTLWTTPTQSSVLAVVPLREEYPIRKKKQLYTDPAIFKHLDAHAIKVCNIQKINGTLEDVGIQKHFTKVLNVNKIMVITFGHFFSFVHSFVKFRLPLTRE